MESNVNLYKLNQKGKEYILKISIIGNNLRLSCKSLLNPTINFTRDYSAENLKQLDKVFIFIQTPFEALELIDKTLKKQKVQVKEEVDIIKLNFFFESKENENPIELKATEENISTTTNNDFISSYSYQNIDTQYSVSDNANYENTSENYLQNIETTNNAINTGFDINNYTNYDNYNIQSENQDIITTNQNIETTYQGQDININTYNEYQSTPVENYQAYESTQNYEEYNTNIQPATYETTTYETTNYQAPLYSPPIEEPSPNQFIQATTTTTTTTNTFNTNNVSDERITKLQDDTNYLKAEHQNIQTQLNNLSGQLNDYQNKITSIGQSEQDNEIQALKNENQLIKQQLQELSMLRKEASEAQYLKSQLSQMDPLRQQATESDMIKSQLAELETLKQKIDELRNTKNQINEINNLKEEFTQINQLKRQLNELNYQKNQALEDNELKERIKQLENINLQQEKEIRILRESQSKIVQNKNVKNVNISSGLESRQLYFEEEPEQICVKGDIIHNAQELELITRKINKSNKKITLNLIYKATVDSDKAQAFHNKCDKAQSTLVLIETNRGKRFGGFTSCSWDGECLEKKDENAFIFSLNKMLTYDNIKGEDAIGCYPKFGPIFMGCQIRIYDNAFVKGGTTFEKGLNFDTQEDYELTGGEREFGVKEIEVYEVLAS